MTVIEQIQGFSAFLLLAQPLSEPCLLDSLHLNVKDEEEEHRLT
jgi:hypothetical protein